jgi:hypothetical protein
MFDDLGANHPTDHGGCDQALVRSPVVDMELSWHRLTAGMVGLA